uniref:RAB37, member RAS oncogene family n=1 Tax=Astyanax mexicanus TaxID=7994 RepID=A0A8B9KDQ2_ASTMX
MSSRQASLDQEVKNGTSRNVLERCASVNEYFDISFKVMLLGDSAVGKTCVLVRFKDGAFLGGNFIATVGIDFRVMADCGRFVFFSLCLALLLLYDITRKSSFDNIRAWLTEIHEYAQKDVVIMLLGNKVRNNIVHHIYFFLEYGVPFMETSAKTGLNVELAFHAIARELTQRAASQPHEPKFQIHDYIESQKQKSNCCGGLM